jgi:serine/threonine protein kinase
LSYLPGARLGPFEIVGVLGSGGMGEVYKARDTRLERTVAIKVLPDEIAADPDRRARFEREARATAILSHPNICTLYDVGEHASSLFLVMEHLSGETLAARLARGPLPLAQVLDYGAQIAEALSAAHHAGFVHRDLKPANVMLTKTGVKLLDFGLAKASASPVPGLAMLPTTPADLTALGTILGTLQYMAPEQLEGRDADSRTDIFALGAVLYEMVTGRRAFEGSTQASLIGAILHQEPPPMSTLQPGTPPLLDHVVRRCLDKSPDARTQTASDVAHELRWISQQPVGGPHSESPRDEVVWRRVAYAASTAAMVLAAVLAYVVLAPRSGRLETRSAEQPIRVSVLPPANTLLTSVQLALSPDGTSLAYVGLSGAQRQLWIYSLATGESHQVSGVDDAYFPFWSPDGRHVGFVSHSSTLVRIGAAGGPSQRLAPADRNSSGSWNDQGTILFEGADQQGILRIPSAGGAPVRVTSLDTAHQEFRHSHPRFLPDGRRFLYFVASRKPEYQGVYARSLDVDDHKQLIATVAHAEYIEPGYLLFVRDAVLYAQRFNLSRLQLEGEPEPVAQAVNVNIDNAGAAVSSSRNGAIAYITRAAAASGLVWLDRQGKSSPVIGARGPFREVELSPDATRALVRVRGTDVALAGDVWSVDLVRGIASRLTFNTKSLNVRWSRDGEFAIFDANVPDAAVYRKRADGAASSELLWRGVGSLADVHTDGRLLIEQPGRCVVIDPSRNGAAETIIESTSLASCGRFSEDGRSLAFTLEESGRSEVYVVPFPQGRPRVQLSSDGGRAPRWRRDGRELFYLSPDGKIMSVGLLPGAALRALQPRKLFQEVRRTSRPDVEYDVTADGQRFLMIDPFEDPGAERLTVIAHWTATLPR